jgi:hypothetical protein
VSELLTTLGTVLTHLVALAPLQPVHPPRSSGFAGTILGAILAIGLLAVVAKFATTRPRHRRRPPR